VIKASALVALAACVTPSLKAQTDSRFQVTAIRAVLFFQDSGTFGSFDAMAEGPDAPALWNTIIGEGAAGSHPSAATVVLVRVHGPFAVPGNKPALHVTAAQEMTRGTRVVLNRRIQLDPFFTEIGEAWIPIIIYDTGCGAVQVTAAISVGTTETPGLTKTVPFQCGE